MQKYVLLWYYARHSTVKFAFSAQKNAFRSYKHSLRKQKSATFATMKTLYLFNPSHDEALASGSPYYCPSKTARRLSAEWAVLPMLWAGADDYVCLTDDYDGATDARCHYVRWAELRPTLWQQIDRVEPWGWDPLVRHALMRHGCPETLLPSDGEIGRVRQLSSRESTTALLPALRRALAEVGIPTIGESFILREEADLSPLTQRYGGVMLKSLWSCSGRGVFGVEGGLSESASGRVRRLLREQGGLEAEPRYEGVLDFALEFEALADGSVRALGISMFDTSDAGAYLGNAVAPQPVLEERLFSKWNLPLSSRCNCSGEGDSARLAYAQLQHICCDKIAALLGGNYVGLLGVDMMLVHTDAGNVLHPCIELNLRRTMGHVALALHSQSFPSSQLPSRLKGLFSWSVNH